MEKVIKVIRVEVRRENMGFPDRTVREFQNIQEALEFAKKSWSPWLGIWLGDFTHSWNRSWSFVGSVFWFKVFLKILPRIRREYGTGVLNAYGNEQVGLQVFHGNEIVFAMRKNYWRDER